MRFALWVALALGLALPAGCAVQGRPPVLPDAHLVEETSARLVQDAALCLTVPQLRAAHAADDALYQRYHDDIVARVVEVSYNAGAPRSFGSWEARDDFFSEEASDEGLLTQWAPDYYITHDWSAYGQQILAMVPGDTLALNGRALVVERVFDYPKDAYLDEMLEACGLGPRSQASGVVLQTCEPASELNRIVLCR